MSNDRRRRIDRTFASALEVDPDERETWLRKHCAEDMELRREVEAMLRATEVEDAELTPGALAGGPLWQTIWSDDVAPSLPPPERFGRWRIDRELARGGMAVVYVAERDDPTLEQTVALKVLHGGGATDEALSRFEQERSILATLDHPNIAGLLDGGVADDGRPYLAMELVRGQPIDAWCESRGLAIDTRLRLVTQVGEALRYAHTNLVVHRDVKPSNVLVDERGTVKLLDFGIAKLLERGRFASEAPPTRRTMRVMTPEYASPEQVRGESITTASDVYQLGLLMYELLSGTRAQTLDDVSPSAIERICCEEDPPPPSTRVSRDSVVARSLRGDLDAIVMKALRKDPSDRYVSMDAFLDDIERYLAGLPIRARRPTIGYRLGKFVRRRRGLMVGVAAVIVALLAGLVATGWQARETARERDDARAQMLRAEQTHDFLLSLFEAADPDRTLGVEVTARQILEQGARRIEDELIDQPDARSDLQKTIGDVYFSLAAFDEAYTHYSQAFAAVGEDDPRAATLASRVAIAATELGRFEEASELLRRSLLARSRHFGSESAEVASVIVNLGNSLLEQRRFEEAETQFRDAERIFIETLGPDHPEVLLARHNLGRTLSKLDRHPEAEALFRKNRDAYLRLEEPHPAQAAMSAQEIATSLHRQERLVDAEPFYREALETRVRLYGDDHPATAATLNNLGVLLLDLERFDQADPVLQRALAARRTMFDGPHPLIAGTLGHLARVRMEQGEWSAAEVLLAESVTVYERTVGSEHSRTVKARERLSAARRLPADD
ncbi:MAG: serine/threonine-protein kinase [Acidobacteriota bacterium]|nr:serine/threonine-protein kinase [Acidobacteriota bacterium]